MDPKMEELFVRLVRLGLEGGDNAYLTSSGEAPAEVVSIGRQLDELGGMEAMRGGHANVAHHVSPLAARLLESAWDGIGSWRG